MDNITLTTLVMINNKETKQTLIQNRTFSWEGCAFPGGHVEDEESVTQCAIREVKEETGLTISNLIFCGIMHWFKEEENRRYLVFLYKTYDFKGNLKNSREGEHFWHPTDKLSELNLSKNLQKYLHLFFETQVYEAFGIQRKNQEPNIQKFLLK